jgi:PE family
MSGMITPPELINTAATNLANIGSTLSEAHTAGAARRR